MTSLIAVTRLAAIVLSAYNRFSPCVSEMLKPDTFSKETNLLNRGIQIEPVLFSLPESYVWYLTSFPWSNCSPQSTLFEQSLFLRCQASFFLCAELSPNSCSRFIAICGDIIRFPYLSMQHFQADFACRYPSIHTASLGLHIIQISFSLFAHSRERLW